MVQTQIGPMPSVSFVDKRRFNGRQSSETRIVDLSKTPFTANGAGTTTTIVGANAAPGTNDVNIARRGEKGRLYTSAGVLKEETVFEVTGIAVGASTTLTFAPAAAVATASGDIFRWVGLSSYQSVEDMDSRLTTLGYTADRLAAMGENDKVFALRRYDDPLSSEFS